MNKSMVIGVVAGVAVATAGGVAGYTLLGPVSLGNEQGSAEVIDAQETSGEAAALAVQPQSAAPGVAPQSAPAAAPVARQSAPSAAPVARQSAPAPAPAPAAPRERCWDEEVTVTEAPKDEHRIGGTAAGAVVGGAIGREIGDNDLSTAVGAAAG